MPPLAWYEVLDAVAEAPEERLKMGDLAEALVISRGGLTKLVDRLVKAGLLERTFCETDRRVSYATLTPAGPGAARRDAADRRRRAAHRLHAPASAPARPTALRDALVKIDTATCVAPEPQALRRAPPAARSLAASISASTSASRPSRISSTGSGSPLTIPSKNSLRSW